MKRCSRCGVEKPAEEFYRRGKWLFNPCRPCKKIENAERHAAHREERLAKMRAYAKEHRAEIDAKIREWRKAHPQTVKGYSDRDYRKHHDKRLAYHKRRRAENGDRFKEWQREYRKAHPEKSAERLRKWRAANPERYRQTSRRSTNTRHARRRNAFVEVVDPLTVYERGRGICGICSKPVPADAFNVDHIIPFARGGEHSYANTQPAHPSCNFRKGARLQEELAA